MRRTVTEVLRRGFENVLANWPLLAIRVAESVVFLVILGVAFVAVLVPLAVSIVGSDVPQIDPGDMPGFIVSILADHLVIILWVFVVAMLVLLVLMAVHSFVIAGCARVYVDAERQVARIAAPNRDNLRAFTIDRWLEGGKAAGWAVFWIYNITWSIAAMVIMIPFALLLVVMLLMRENGPVMAVTGCVGVAGAIVFILPVAIVTGIWTQKAIVNAAARKGGLGASLRTAWRELMSDLARHIAVTAVMIVVSFAAAMVFGSISALSSIGHQASAFNLVLMPARFGVSIVNSIFSAAVSAWFLACFASLAVEPR